MSYSSIYNAFIQRRRVYKDRERGAAQRRRKRKRQLRKLCPLYLPANNILLCEVTKKVFSVNSTVARYPLARRYLKSHFRIYSRYGSALESFRICDSRIVKLAYSVCQRNFPPPSAFLPPRKESSRELLIVASTMRKSSGVPIHARISCGAVRIKKLISHPLYNYISPLELCVLIFFFSSFLF